MSLRSKIIFTGTALVIAVALSIGAPSHAQGAEARAAREHPVNKKLRKQIASIDLQTFGGKSDDVKQLKLSRFNQDRAE